MGDQFKWLTRDAFADRVAKGEDVSDCGLLKGCAAEVTRAKVEGIVYRPLADTPLTSPSPAQRHGYVTFGLFQRPSKMNANVWDAIAATLRGSPP